MKVTNAASSAPHSSKLSGAAIVKATALFPDPEVITQASRGLGEAMVGISVADIPAPHRLADRGW